MTKRTPAHTPASQKAKQIKTKKGRPASRRRARGFDYQTLEQRLPLDASVSFAGGLLELSNFTGNELDVSFNANTGELTATIGNNENFRDDPGGVAFPQISDDGTELGPEVVVSGVTDLLINSGVNLSVELDIADLFLNSLSVRTQGDIDIDSGGFAAFNTDLISGGNITQGGSGGDNFGALRFISGGSTSFNQYTATSFGGNVGGDLSIIASGDEDVIIDFVFDENVILPFETNFVFANPGGEGLVVDGDASIESNIGSISQTLESPFVNGGTLNVSADAVNIPENPDTGDPAILTNLDLSNPDNNFNVVNVQSNTGTDFVSVLVFDTNNFEVQNASSEEITHLAAGRGNAGSPLRNEMTGLLTPLTGTLSIASTIESPNLVLQASDGVTQDSNSLIRVGLLQLGGTDISEGSGDFLFNGTVVGPEPELPGLLEEFSFTSRVRGNLDFTTTSEISLVSEPVSYPPDSIDADTGLPTGRPDELFEDSYVDGNARINANRIDFDVDFETTKFVLTVESDVMQEAGTSVITDQLYVVGKEIDLSNDTNDTNQIAGRGVGDESFIRYSDVGTFRIVSLDGNIDTIDGNSANIPDPGLINGLSTERIPEVGIGVESFIDITTGFGGEVDNPRVGLPPVELDDIETFEVIRDDLRAQFLTNDFGQDGQNVVFVEFIYDGVSPFRFIAQSVDAITGEQTDDFDAELALYDEVGNLVAVSDDPSLSLNASISDTDIAGGLPAGRYYLASAAFSATFADDFTVQTEFDDGTPAQPTGTLLITLESNIDVDDEPREEMLARLESFTAPEVRRSFFQDEDAPIDTEKLFVSVLEDGAVNFTSTQNQIDAICIFETDDFVLHSSTTINIEALDANGDVFLTAPGEITVENLTAQGNVEITTPARVIGQNLNAVGGFDISGDLVNLDGVTAGGDVSVTATNTALLTNFDVAGGIAAASSSDDIVIDGVRAQGDVSLAAADDIRIDNTNGIRRLAGANLTLFADNVNNDGLNGVFLFTDVDSVTTRILRGGDIFLNERSDIEANLSTNNGEITLQAAGNITGNASVIQPGHDISLIARGDDSDIAVDFVSVLGSSDNVRLFAGDDITATVTAGNLQAQALNSVEDDEVSVNLNTTVRTLNVSSGIMSDPNPNRGDIIVNESNPLILTRAVNAFGRITVSAEGNITTGNVQANRISTGNAIEISANGLGSDLQTARVVVRDGAGGVLLSADDDIVDGNVNDRLAVVADNVTYESGNNTVDSFNGIIGHSFVNEITVNSTSTTAAGAFLFNTGNVSVTNTVISNGQFSLTNRSGTATIEGISILSNQLSNRVFVRTSGTGGDILVGEIDAGINGIVTLDSADDVFDTDLLDDLFISGEFLNVTARNNNVDSFDGIILNIDVDNFADRVLNGGETFVRRES